MILKSIRGKRYVRRTLGFIRFVLIFLQEFIKANLEVARIVLFVKKDKYHSGFIDFPVEDMTFFEALFLSHCITLTPGTVTVLLDWDLKILCIHLLDYSDPSGTIKDIESKLKHGIWMFSR